MSERRPRLSFLLLTGLLLAAPGLFAATPPSGGVSDTATEVAWVVDHRPPTAAFDCDPNDDATYDNFDLTITPPPYSFQVVITVTPLGADDWDLFVYDSGGNEVGSSGNFPGAEIVVLDNPAGGVYTVCADPYAPATDAAGVAEIVVADSPPGNVTITEPDYEHFAPPALGEPDSTFFDIWGPNDPDSETGIGVSAGEPSIGIPTQSNLALQSVGLPPRYPGAEPTLTETMYIANLETLRTTFDDCTDPPAALWKDVSPATHVATLDPILETEQFTFPSRTHSLQLNAKRSLYELSDDNGESWMSSITGGGINAGVDHQGIGMGPYPGDPLDNPCGPAPLYPTATYYASQDVAVAQAAISCDGGLTFLSANPMYTAAQCGGLHGHPESAPDGATFVPNKDCFGEAGFAATENGTATWSIHTVPGTTPGDDPGIGIGYDAGDPVTDYTVYIGIQNGDGHPLIAWSDDWRDPGAWQGPVDVGAPFNIASTAFPAVIAGDRDRAAYAFLGSTTPGATNDNTNSLAIWHLYVAVTYDRGANWEVSKLTEGDPVQRSTICLGGTTCGTTRNLLDFMDIQRDEQGRILIAWADGCVGNCKTSFPNSYVDTTRITRQAYGDKSLYAAFDNVFDPSTATAPKSPYVDAILVPGGDDDLGNPLPPTVNLQWSTPFDGNDSLTNFEIYRREDPGAFVPLDLGVAPTENSYNDTTLVSGVNYFYQVLATNGSGTSPSCFEAEAKVPTVCDACTLPGCVLAPSDGGDQAIPHLDIESLSVGQPFIDDGTGTSLQKVIFTLKMADGTAPAVNNAFAIIWSRQNPDPNVPVGAAGTMYDRNMVNLRQTATGPECHFGKITEPSFNEGYDLVTLPAADCQFRPDGTIVIGVETSVLEDCNPIGTCTIAPGYTLGGMEVRVFASNVSGQPVSQLSSSDNSGATPYTLIDNDALCGLNTPPVALADEAIGPPNQNLLIDVVANDFDNDAGDTVSVVPGSVTDGGHGTVTDNGDGTVTYVPDPNFAGEDEFSYLLTDGEATDTGVVTVLVTSLGCTFAQPSIFDDDFETQSLNNWAEARNPDGDMSISASGPLDGDYSLLIHVERPPLPREHFVIDDTPGAVDHYCYSFLFDPNSIALPTNRPLKIGGSRHTGGQRTTDLAVRYDGAGYQIGYKALKESTLFEKLAFGSLVDGTPNLIEVEWKKQSASGANDGIIRLYVNGVLIDEKTNVATDLRSLSRTGVGYMGLSSVGTSGDLKFDAFVSRGQ